MFSNLSVAGKIKNQREKLGLRQTDLSNALQISPQAVSKWERGESTPDISVLVPLAKLLNVSVDWLLGYYDELTDVFEATVFISGISGFTKKAQSMDLRNLKNWINGIFYNLTEAVIRYDAIPVKYMGDGFLCFFSGPDHKTRAIKASIDAKKIIGETLGIGLNSGDILFGTFGHPDYANKDIYGTCVNIASRILSWAGENTNSKIAASYSVVENSNMTGNVGKSSKALLKGIEQQIEIFEIILS